MSSASLGEPERVVLYPGECQVSAQRITMSTLLGSCVSVCLYDPVRRVMGMNHFLLANRRYTKDMPVLSTEAGRYGIHAMELLVNNLLAMGAQRRHLKAKAFGGGNVLGHRCSGEDKFMCVGAVNVRFVREFLSNDRIPLIAADLGGNFGRQIHFTGSDFSVYVRKIESEQSRHLLEEERLYWRHSMEEHEHPTSRVDYW